MVSNWPVEIEVTKLSKTPEVSCLLALSQWKTNVIFNFANLKLTEFFQIVGSSPAFTQLLYVLSVTARQAKDILFNLLVKL